MRINAKIQNDIRNAYRAGEDIAEIARRLGYEEQEVEKVIFPHGRQPRELPVVIRRTKPSPKPEEKAVLEISPKKKKDEKWIKAGKKAWETRQKRLAAASAPTLPPPIDQPVVVDLTTMPQKDVEEAVKLIGEAMEYIQVGLESIRRALELLKR